MESVPVFLVLVLLTVDAVLSGARDVIYAVNCGGEAHLDSHGISIVLVLKFSEVYFNQPNQKLFDVVLNREHVIVSDLDIYSKVGRGVAHDEIIPFKIRDNLLMVNDEVSMVSNGRIRVDFIKGPFDNPKINAILLIKGTLADVPMLPSVTDGILDEPEERTEEARSSKSKRASGPRTPDPYAADDSSIMLPVFVAIGAFIPLLFCLCRL
ncbi:unnamed protein product [Notodromas monacha]|uniref:Malectin domain-containing protein n=1 Tax=Notodromas monacha TaxID=399045 RepID=A0A7R9GEG5_9CRUS|nr:unnamed protein product [Notodromas monacha]CAG0918247.1 unnamed protein product [Notodromas monacha]